MLKIIDKGLTDYADCLSEQERIMDAVLAEKRICGQAANANSVLLTEHRHVYTLGKSGDISNMLINKAFMREIGAVFYRTNRGGDVTYHGPGQLVCYPIIDLARFGIGVRTYIEMLEQVVIEAVAHYGLVAGLKAGAVGVWIEADIHARARKICAIGVRVSHGVTMHGFALNVNTDLRYFSYINPCGLSFGVTSLQQELGREVPMTEVKELVKRIFSSKFIIP
ncbi:MAG: lipoyl(octanoyl) transferase LipB [Bacteroidales bacterium]|nr:lipoyl(octanoyl) transferase LipB [Bacteroidales bacterium]